MAISVAFFGLGVGSLVVHIEKGNKKWQARYENKENLVSKIVFHAIAYAASIPIFVIALSHIPPSTSDIFLFYLISSIPFFFVGSIMALVFHAMPKKINKLYFADLVGAAAATLLLDPLMQLIGAEHVILLTALLVGASALVGAFLTKYRQSRTSTQFSLSSGLQTAACLVLACVLVLPVFENASGTKLFEVNPGPNKGLYYQLQSPEKFQHLSERWNSFSRIDVTNKIPGTMNVSDSTEAQRELASIIIDADAGTPIFDWNGSKSDLSWLRSYTDFLPYRLTAANSTLVIGGGGGEDIQTALAGGSQSVTAVELNPLIVSAVRQFGSQSSGNVYERGDVHLFIDDGRHFISSSKSKYDVIAIKLVDSWAAQLSGGYALSENYLYTTEAFQKYLQHLSGNGILVMVRWNFELPRLLPLVVDSVMKETGEDRAAASKHIIVIEDRPGLYFGRTDDSQKYYPMLLMIKTTPFTQAEIDLANDQALQNNGEITLLAGRYIEPPYYKLFDTKAYPQFLASVANPTIPTDDAPFYFARERIPQQMIILLETVLAISGGLAILLAVRSWKKTGFAFGNRAINSASASLLVFAVFIGLGFMSLEITFIQKFLLLLGTPILALTSILFSILLSGGIGAYLSGRTFSGRPYAAAFVTLPILGGLLLLYYFSLQGIIDSTIGEELPIRVATTVALLFPLGLLMGFQFPSLVGMASIVKNRAQENDTTLLWGANVIASIIGTVLAATLAMAIGFNGTLLFGLGMYAGAAASALLGYIVLVRARLTIIGD